MTPDERVQAAIVAAGLRARVVVFEASTGTAAEAAAAVGCQPGQIVKSLLFLAAGWPTMVLTAGDRQVDTAGMATLLGLPRKKLKLASREEVRNLTGYEAGGVPPLGLAIECDVLVDGSLRRFEKVWAAAGTANAVFEARTDDLVSAVKGQWADITPER